MRKHVECDAGAVARLLEIMSRLRDPDTGCPWDLQQNFATIAPYTLEEAYEVAEAIQRNDAVDLCKKANLFSEIKKKNLEETRN